MEFFSAPPASLTPTPTPLSQVTGSPSRARLGATAITLILAPSLYLLLLLMYFLLSVVFEVLTPLST